MKTVLTILLLISSFHVFSQEKEKKIGKKKTEKNKNSELFTSNCDSLNTLLIKTKDSLNLLIKEKINTKETKKDKVTKELILDYILIGKQKWCTTNIGSENSLFETWVKENKFQECTSEQEWNDVINSNNSKPAYYVLKGLNTAGYFFNVEGLRMIQENPPKGWRIAKYEDFQELVEYVNKLKIKSINSLQLILSNFSPPVQKQTNAIHPLIWAGLPIYNIYNLSLYPVSYFSGFESLLTYNKSLNLFSRYEEATNKIYFTEISTMNKAFVVERKLGSEASDYGFLVRLIK